MLPSLISSSPENLGVIQPGKFSAVDSERLANLQAHYNHLEQELHRLRAEKAEDQSKLDRFDIAQAQLAELNEKVQQLELQKSEAMDCCHKLQNSISSDEIQKQIDISLSSFGQKLKSEQKPCEKYPSPGDNSGIDAAHVRSMIEEAIDIYDADKTGLPDYALEPSGASIINIRCSETYDPNNIQYRVLGFPVWSTSNSPRTVIQPNSAPGECWAFKGFEGQLVIKLSKRIVPTSFTYEHVRKVISRDGHIQSAPRTFQVLGLADENDRTGSLLGTFEYLDNDKPLQNFKVQDPNPGAYEFIELRILANHGHPEYTCLYRFRVHGRTISY